MADWSANLPHRAMLSWMSPECLGTNRVPSISVSAAASGTWQSANRAVFYPLILRTPYLVRKVWFANGTSTSGNWDVGVYNLDGVLFVSAGSTAQSGTSVIQFADVTDILLTPGHYYLACVMDNTTAHCVRPTSPSAAQGKAVGMAEMASAFPLPATATLATFATSGVSPLCGLTNRTVLS